MPLLREEAFKMCDRAEIEILQKGEVLGMSSTVENTSRPIQLEEGWG